MKRNIIAGCKIVLNQRIQFTIQLTAPPGIEPLYGLYYQTLWLFSGAPEDPEIYTLMDNNYAGGLDSAVTNMTHGVRTDDNEVQSVVALLMSQTRRP